MVIDGRRARKLSTIIDSSSLAPDTRHELHQRGLNCEVAVPEDPAPSRAFTFPPQED
jgi:hypothetical protein